MYPFYVFDKQIKTLKGGCFQILLIILLYFLQTSSSFKNYYQEHCIPYGCLHL